MAIAVDFNSIEEKDFATLEAGNYVGTIVNVEYVPTSVGDDGKERGNYINVDFDVTEGPLTGYAGEINEKFGFWPLRFSLSLKPNVAWKFKNFIKSIEDYDYDKNVKGGEWDEHSIEGCDFGISIQMEHYIGKDDKEKTRLKRWGNHVFGTPEKARKNELKAVEDAFTEEANTLNTATSWLAAEADNPFA